jgi:hypothetical protein
VAGSDRRPDDPGSTGVSTAGSEPGGPRSELQTIWSRVVLALCAPLHKVHRSLQETRRLLWPNCASAETHSLKGNARKHYD